MEHKILFHFVPRNFELETISPIAVSCFNSTQYKKKTPIFEELVLPKVHGLKE
jgi:hypothetical protein